MKRCLQGPDLKETWITTHGSYKRREFLARVAGATALSLVGAPLVLPRNEKGEAATPTPDGALARCFFETPR